MTLSDRLDSYDATFWDFANYREKNTLSKYPAIMVAPMQEQLIREILAYDTSISHVMDPFMGSGTVLSVGQKVGLDVFGCDINPLATLITRVRLQGVPNRIQYSNDELRAKLKLYLGNVPKHHFTNIDKWFREDVIESLSLLRAVIMDEKDIQIRRFYWCCFSEVVKKYSNTRTSTFKLHVKEKSMIDVMANDSVEYFKCLISQYSTEYRAINNGRTIQIQTGDSIELLKNYHDCSIDLICTSPPYGDNHTTVTYGQYSILPLLWIDLDDLDPFDRRLLNNFSAIDTASLGGQFRRKEIVDSLDKYRAFLTNVSSDKQKKVISFWNDYENVFANMARILKDGKLLVLTLGNRRVDNQEMPFDLINDRLAEEYGLKLDSTIVRNISGKRMPIRVSNVANHSVNSMSKEYVKIYRKG